MKTDKPTLGIFIATPGRASLMRTLWSIAYQQEGVVDVLVVGDGFHAPTADLCKMFVEAGWLPQLRYVATQKTRDWGHSQQNYALKHVKGDYIVYQDDDDIFLPRSLSLIRSTAAKRPGRPIIARVKTPLSGILWQEPGQDTMLDGHCLALPNDKDKLGYFYDTYNGDQCFIHTSLRPYQDEWVWADIVLTLTRPVWRLWPRWNSEGETSWCCDLAKDANGVPGATVATVYLEEDGEHYNARYSGEFSYDVAIELVEFTTWAAQGRDVWFTIPADKKVMFDSLSRRGYTEHKRDATSIEMIHEGLPAWWTPVPRFSHLISPEGVIHPDWRDEWGP